MKLRVLAVALIGALLLVFPPSAAAMKVHHTELTVDTLVDRGGGRILVSGTAHASGFWCDERAVRLVGTKPNGKAVEVDWTLTSLPGDAWALIGNTAGFNTLSVQLRKVSHGRGKHRYICAEASKVVSRLVAPRRLALRSGIGQHRLVELVAGQVAAGDAQIGARWPVAFLDSLKDDDRPADQPGDVTNFAGGGDEDDKARTTSRGTLSRQWPKHDYYVFVEVEHA